VVGVPKISTADTTLTAVNTLGQKVSIPVPQGTMLSIVATGLHSNSKYWPDPYAFKPERFFGEWNQDASIPFSAGSRVCLGRRFFETEATAILALLISRYRVTIKEEPQFAHETFEQKKARVLKTKHALSLT
ncbi:cytochrome P450, partial [Ephemerocybe angulata]